MDDIAYFIEQYEGSQKAILEYLHHLLQTELELTDKIRYKIPFYYRKSWICYLNPGKKGTVELAFIRGDELSNEQGLLDAKDRKQVRSIEFGNLSEIPKTLIKEIIHEAIILDETVKYQHPGRRK